MMAFWQFLRFLNPKYIIAGIIFAALGYAFYIATDRIILQQEIKNYKATEAQNHERKKTDETIRNADDRLKCELLGGVFANGQCI
jgi:hypothetical protein